MVNGLAAIRNMASDGHARHVQPQDRHARVAVNSAKTVASFLVEAYLAKRMGSTLSTTARSAV
ncbi:abortive infection family protein [Corynebacterium flavescens]|uniref:abortive infection family protein n=1 Tax=Corynebacterium flavescens TaxID=28028 RepID=UPI003FD31F10